VLDYEMIAMGQGEPIHFQALSAKVNS